MKATCWHGAKNIQVDTVPDPKLLNPRDAIIRVTSTAICGSDLHPYNGFIPSMKRGDILGHEFMGEVIEKGGGVSNLKVGTISVAGVYGGFVDKFPMGAIVNRSLTIKSGQTHVHRYMRPLLDRIQKGDIDPTFVITHRLSLSDAPGVYETFNNKEDECLKAVLTP